MVALDWRGRTSSHVSMSRDRSLVDSDGATFHALAAQYAAAVTFEPDRASSEVFHLLYWYDIGMPMKPTLIHLPEDDIQQLDKRANADGISRSQVVRDAVASYLDMDAAAELDERVRKAYEEFPLDTPDDWGDMETFLVAVRAEKAKHL